MTMPFDATVGDGLGVISSTVASSEDSSSAASSTASSSTAASSSAGSSAGSSSAGSSAAGSSSAGSSSAGSSDASASGSPSGLVLSSTVSSALDSAAGSLLASGAGSAAGAPPSSSAPIETAVLGAGPIATVQPRPRTIVTTTASHTARLRVPERRLNARPCLGASFDFSIMSNLGSRVGSARAVEPPHRDLSREMWRCCNSRGTAAFEP